MAQLIKLNDYISRYEVDLSHYTSLFVRLKKRRWDSILDSTANVLERNELKQAFLDQLFVSQIKWASSTVFKKSYPHSGIYSDSRLRKLVQRFPDSFMLMYTPVMQLKKARIQLDVYMLLPSKLVCMVFLEDGEEALYIGTHEHFWKKSYRNKEEKVLNPVLPLRRMENIAAQIFRARGIEWPIEKIIVSENSYITYPDVPADIRIVDRQHYEAWIQELRSYHSPMKLMQFKAAKALLEQCVKTSAKRSD
ncbi:NERD domain-containing protein [Siminovitchia sediminis]|uniref:NERD domain-containing protein n=1 Tax=Siminovitchia sediminis TaxID=1274353 RepID=A0ABW4KHZ2_9BACI